MTTKKHEVPEELLSGLLANYKKPEDLIGENGLLKQLTKLLVERALDANGDNRTLYSLRHTYATLEMLRGEVDIHTLSKQMDNSAAMIERHYSKLTATMAAGRLA